MIVRTQVRDIKRIPDLMESLVEPKYHSKTAKQMMELKYERRRQQQKVATLSYKVLDGRDLGDLEGSDTSREIEEIQKEREELKNSDIATLLKRQRKKFEPVRDARVHNSVVKYAISTEVEPPLEDSTDIPLGWESGVWMPEYIEKKSESPVRVKKGMMESTVGRLQREKILGHEIIGPPVNKYAPEQTQYRTKDGDRQFLRF